MLIAFNISRRAAVGKLRAPLEGPETLIHIPLPLDFDWYLIPILRVPKSPADFPGRDDLKTWY